MKKRVLTAANLLLGGLIAALGVGCHSQKKVVKAQPNVSINSPIQCMYGIPYNDIQIAEPLNEVPEQPADTIVEEPQLNPADSTKQVKEEAEIDRKQIRVKYGVPAGRR